MTQSLAVEYSQRVFDKQLLHRVLDKKRDIMFGTNRHQMKDIMKKGNLVATKGGVWVPIICPETTRLSGCHYQTA